MSRQQLSALCHDSCESLLTHMLTIPLEIRGNTGCQAEVACPQGGGMCSWPDSSEGVQIFCTPLAQALLCIYKVAVFG